MNERSIVQAPEAGRQGAWLDEYMPQGALGPLQPRPKFFNFAAIRGIIFRQRWLVAGIIALALLGGLVVTLLSTPMYQADAKVSIQPYGQYVVEGQETEQGFSAIQIFDFLATQVEVIKSRSLAEVVVSDLDLAERNDLLGKDIDQSRAPGMSDAQWLKAKKDLAVTILTDSVVAEVPTKNWIIEIGFQSENAALSAEIANAYADAFVATGSRNSVEDNQYALEYLKGQIEDTRKRLAEAEQVANGYARSSGIIVQSDGNIEEGAAQSTLTAVNLPASMPAPPRHGLPASRRNSAGAQSRTCQPRSFRKCRAIPFSKDW